MEHPMTDRICVVTGATDGIGWMSALGIARTGARVVIVGRNAAKTEERATRLARETGNEAVEHEVADLSVQAEIRALAERLNRNLPRIDVLVNNVGALFTRRELSSDGIEMTWALNHLSPFLLTGLVLDQVRASDQGRIVTVSSGAHRGPQVNFDDPQLAGEYRGWRAYQQSKLANLLFTRELALRLEGSPVTANCLHPGFVNSRFGSNNAGIKRVLLTVAKTIFAISEEKGADTVIYLATDPGVAGVSGEYFVKRQPAETSSQSQDPDARRTLWDISETMTGLSYPA